MAGKQDTPDTPAAEKQEAPKLTKADAAKLVKREVPVIDDKTKKPTGTTKLVAVKEDEVFDFAEYDDHVVVCTIDGQKLHGDKK